MTTPTKDTESPVVAMRKALKDHAVGELTSASEALDDAFTLAAGHILARRDRTIVTPDRLVSDDRIEQLTALLKSDNPSALALNDDVDPDAEAIFRAISSSTKLNEGQKRAIGAILLGKLEVDDKGTPVTITKLQREIVDLSAGDGTDKGAAKSDKGDDATKPTDKAGLSDRDKAQLEGAATAIRRTVASKSRLSALPGKVAVSADSFAELERQANVIDKITGTSTKVTDGAA